ncbi:MAG TPA: hypothetical protein VKT82_28040 [Ktedonobacterales bacterium]|nr:hypothetical protein [Ktedonobacterales bacterium]
MNELINQITQRTGISESQAQQAVQIVGNFLKQRLPGPAASQVDNFLSQGGQGMGGSMGQAGQNLGGMFGGNQPPPNRP